MIAEQLIECDMSLKIRKHSYENDFKKNKLQGAASSVSVTSSIVALEFVSQPNSESSSSIIPPNP